MIPIVITQKQAAIAEFYWGDSWMNMGAPMIEEALDWWNNLYQDEREDLLNLIRKLYPWKDL